MTNELSSGSAKILQFPARGRKAVSVPHEQSKPSADPKSVPVSGVSFDGAWYHDAAIQESKRIGER